MSSLLSKVMPGSLLLLQAGVVLASPDKFAPAATPPALASSSGSIFTMIFGLLVVVGIMMSIAWLLKRTGFTNMSGTGTPVKIIGGTSVGPRERVVVVEVADQWLVVGVAPGRVNTLATLPKQAIDYPNVAPATKSFSSWLKQTIDKRNGQN